MFYTCVVNQVGPATDGTDTGTTEPVIYIKLTDTKSSPDFTGQYFFAADPGQNQMLAVALAAINGNKTVWVGTVDPPIVGIPGIQRLYLNAS